jgi:hypothetical protein
MVTVPRFGAPRIQRQNPRSPALPTNLGQGVAHLDTGMPTAIGAVGKAVGVLGNVLADIEHKEEVRADKIASAKAVTRATNAANEILYDPENGVTTYMLADAVNAEIDMTARWKTFTEDTLSKLANERQIEYVRARLGEKWTDMRAVMLKHVFKENTKHGLLVVQDSFSASGRLAVKTASTNPDVAKGHIKEAMKAVEELGAMSGLDRKLINSKIKAKTSEIHVNIIAAMFAKGNQDARAAEWFKDNNKEIQAGNARDLIIKTIDMGTKREEAQRAADVIMDRYISERYFLGEGDRGSALADARKIKDGEKRDNVVERINKRFNEMEGIEKKKSGERFTEAVSTILTGGGRDKISTGILAQLNGSQLKALAILEKMRLYNTQPVTDDTVYVKAFIGLSQKEKAALTDAEVLEHYRPYLDDNAFKAFVRTVEQAKNFYAKAGDRESKKPQRFSSTLSFTSILRTALDQAGFIKSTKTPRTFTDKEKHFYAVASVEAMRRIEAEEAATGKKLSRGEQQKVISQIMREKVYIDIDWKIDPKRFGFTLTQDERGRAYVPLKDIPKEDIEKMRSIMIRRTKELKKNTRLNQGDKMQRAYAAYILIRLGVLDKKRFQEILDE